MSEKIVFGSLEHSVRQTTASTAGSSVFGPGGSVTSQSMDLSDAVQVRSFVRLIFNCTIVGYFVLRLSFCVNIVCLFLIIIIIIYEYDIVVGFY